MRNNRGFSLIELSVVIVIIGILITAALATYNVYAQKQMVITSRDNVNAAVEAIAAFKKKNGYYPCPASGTDPRAIATDCAGAAPAGTIQTGGAKSVRIGVVPLSAPDKTGEIVQIAAGDKILDGYRNRLAYAVIETMAVDAAKFSATGEGSIVIRDSNSDASAPPINSKASYIVFSHGPDGLGAYTSAGVARTGCNTSAPDGENCDGDAVFADNGLGARSFTGGNTNFDDFVGTQLNATTANSGGINAFGTVLTVSGRTYPTDRFGFVYGDITRECKNMPSVGRVCRITCGDGKPRAMHVTHDSISGVSGPDLSDAWTETTGRALWSCTDAGAGPTSVLTSVAGESYISADGECSYTMALVPNHPLVAQTCTAWKKALEDF